METPLETNPLVIIDLEESYDRAIDVMQRREWQHRVVLVPDDTPRVEVWSAVGDGVPMPVYERRVIPLGDIPDGIADTSGVASVLRDNVEDILALASLHDTRFDGSNTVGFFRDPERAEEILRPLQMDIERAGSEAPMCWDAESWFEGCNPNDLFPADFDRTVTAFESLASQLVDAALPQGASLRQEDVVGLLRKWHDRSLN